MAGLWLERESLSPNRHSLQIWLWGCCPYWATAPSTGAPPQGGPHTCVTGPAGISLTRGSGRAEGAGTSGVIDRCGHCRSSWLDNGPRHFAESRHHELLGRTHGTRLLSWTSRLVGRARAWGTSSKKIVRCCGRGSDTVPAVPRLF